MGLKRLIEKSKYSIFAARVTVSTKEIDEIVKSVNERYKTPEDVWHFYKTKFLRDNDTSQWHLSPSGLVWTKGSLYNGVFKGQGFYSLRHVLEDYVERYKALHPEQIKQKINQFFKLANYVENVREFESSVVNGNYVYSLKKGDIIPQKVYISEEPDGLGFYIIWDGVSRVATHQLVRHQSFDYQQQSQRYINFSNKMNELLGFYIPPTIISSKQTANYVENVVESFEKYKKAIENGAKPEDARFYLPQSITSRIVFYAPKERCCGRDGIKQFIEKRKYHGQEEIRNFAKTLEKLL